ncbi:MAG TPA: glycosyltransferase family 87 protein [Rhizomicrobium sp.]|nr:glycosyltransferase family 87 protein [Rhizomicrobium sp.]
MQNIVLLLRRGDFLTRQRMTLWAAGLIFGFALCILFLGLTAQGLNDYAGRPLGTDFSNVYAAGVAAVHGDATAPFSAWRQLEAERDIFGPQTPFYGWHYPPFFLLVAAALAQLSYLPALILWQGATLLLYLASLGLLLRKSAAPQLYRDRLWLPLALGFTAVFVNLIHGQNGFLTAALFAFGLALLDERPMLSGLAFGLLCYKPQFAVLIPVVLAATGRWKTLAVSVATILALAAIVSALFGTAVWTAFLESSRFTRTIVLEQGNTGFHKIQSVFAWARMWNGSVALAYAAQILTALTVLGLLLKIWRSDAAAGYKKAALCLAAVLITPYALDYDLVVLAPAIALLIAEGKARGFTDGELLSLTLLWLMPIAARNIAHYAFVPIGVLAMLFSFGLIYRKCNVHEQNTAIPKPAKAISW